ncbi:MAG: hypothetical protein R3F48_12620 [Candidatus Zixiibacteriota bacterium]
MLRLTNNSIEIILFRTSLKIPDNEVIQSLKELFNQQKLKSELYLGLGEIDHMAIIDGVLDIEPKFPFPNIRTVGRIRGQYINYNEQCNNHKLDSAGLVVTCLKINPILLKKQTFGIIESQILPQIGDVISLYESNMINDVYLSLGWSEIILVVKFTSLGNLSDLLFGLRDATCTILETGQTRNAFSVSFSHFFLRLDENCQINGNLPHGNMDARIRVLCKPGKGVSMLNKLDNPRMIIGKYDYAIDVTHSSIKNICNTVTNLRRNYTDQIISTSTDLYLCPR